jgi:hypothetical protein
MGNAKASRLKILQGRYGFKYDDKNFDIPKKLQDDISLEQSIAIINSRHKIKALPRR